MPGPRGAGPRLRRALVEELGRFQGFEPLLLDLDPSLDLEPQEPTLALLRDRAGYLDKMVAELAARRSDAITPLLQSLRKDYAHLIGAGLVGQGPFSSRRGVGRHGELARRRLARSAREGRAATTAIARMNPNLTPRSPT